MGCGSLSRFVVGLPEPKLRPDPTQTDHVQSGGELDWWSSTKERGWQNTRNDLTNKCIFFDEISNGLIY